MPRSKYTISRLEAATWHAFADLVDQDVESGLRTHRNGPSIGAKQPAPDIADSDGDGAVADWLEPEPVAAVRPGEPSNVEPLDGKLGDEVVEADHEPHLFPRR